METKTFKKALITMASGLAIVGLIKADDLITEIRDNEFLQGLRAKAEKVMTNYPEDRVYLQFDKPMYQPGDDIWFSGTIISGTTFKPSEKSEILHIELLNPKGAIEKQFRLVSKNGKAKGDFRLDQDMPGGLYKVRAYTTWQKNEGEEAFYEKEIQVQQLVLPSLKMDLEFQRKNYGAGDEVSAKLELNTNENEPLSNQPFRYKVSLAGEKFLEQQGRTGNDGSMYINFKLPEKLKTSDAFLNVMIDYQGQVESISRAVPVFRNEFKVQFFPEGGDMIQNLPGYVAFRSLNEYGKPADIEGYIKDSEGKEVSKFSSFHAGMGSFNLKPEPGLSYKAVITKPAGCKQVFDLPTALPSGFVMHVDNINPSEMGVIIQSTETEEISLVAQVRGKVCYTNAVNVVPGSNKVIIPVSSFPTGVANITLFDENGIERAERLAFVNKHKQLQISINTDKEKYLPREKVKVTVTVRDKKGMPVPAHLGLAVTNDQLVSLANDKSGNILSKLYLEPDLKEKVDEPSFYFDPKEAKADKALDHLLLTSGWRRFTWEQVMNDEMPDFTFRGEKATLSGQVLDAYTGQPVSNAHVKIGKKNITTDDNGKFIIRKIDLSEHNQMTVSKDGYSATQQVMQDYDQMLSLYLYSNQARNNRMVEEEVGMAEDFMVVPNAVNEVERAEPAMAMGQGMMKKPAMDRKAAVPAQEKAPMALDRLAKDEAKKADLDEAKNLELRQGFVHDKRVGKLKVAEKAAGNNQNAVAVKTFYRARQFPIVEYKSTGEKFNREDFRTTVFWEGDLSIDKSGTKTVEFYNCDEITSFRITAEGIGSEGSVGRQEKTFYTQLPFSMNVKLPIAVVSGDLLSVPLTLVNNTGNEINGALKVITPDGFAAAGIIPQLQMIPAGGAKTIFLDYKVKHTTGNGDFTVSFTGAGHSDSFSKRIKIEPKGFPVSVAFSGNELEKEFAINIKNPVEGSIQASLSAFPSVVGDIMKGVEAILREPSGCFEQTSMSSYPNAMVMDYLRATESKDDKLIASTTNLLDRGYKKLTSFEAKEKGYEWFGASPAHEALTAYGLMQFNDLKEVYKGVDQNMIDRTANWLLARRDGNGGFLRNGRALDNFGAANEDITNAYIVYALTEAGYRDLKKELDRACSKAISSSDPYQLALVANAYFKLKEEKQAEKCLNLLCKSQNADGSFDGKTHSVTRSTGNSLKIETSSLAILAMLRSSSINNECLNKTVKYLTASRSGYGAFGTTQGTILALKALTAYAKFSKKTAEPGMICFYVDGKKVAEQVYKMGEKQAIEIRGLEKYLKEGKHDLKVKFEQTKSALPFSVGVSWHTALPQSSEKCELDIDLKTAVKTVKMGETLRLTAVLSNKTSTGLASPIAIIGIPAGFTFQPWQLKELMEKKTFDYYEVTGNSLVLYYRQFAPDEKRKIDLDLKAEIPGVYEAPASSSHLYYTNEHKKWVAFERITISKS